MEINMFLSVIKTAIESTLRKYPTSQVVSMFLAEEDLWNLHNVYGGLDGFGEHQTSLNGLLQKNELN